jgi:hypothetical protein
VRACRRDLDRRGEMHGIGSLHDDDRRRIRDVDEEPIGPLIEDCPARPAGDRDRPAEHRSIGVDDRERMGGRIGQVADIRDEEGPSNGIKCQPVGAPPTDTLTSESGSCASKIATVSSPRLEVNTLFPFSETRAPAMPVKPLIESR